MTAPVHALARLHVSNLRRWGSPALVLKEGSPV
jgi:hypothetical protein